MAGRPRKPTAVLELSGALAKNPQRRAGRENEPRPTSPLGAPPADFLKKDSLIADRLRSIWYELEQQAPEGVLTGCDRMVFENACRTQYIIRYGQPTNGHFSTMKAYLSEMGMTPAGRTRVATQKAKAADQRAPEGWAALAEERLGTVQ